MLSVSYTHLDVYKRQDPDFNLAIQSLEDLRKNIRLINVREKSIPVANEDQEQTYQVTTLATVYVPNEQRQFFLNKIEKYLNEQTPSNKPKNQPLINNIADIQKALSVDSFWIDSRDLIPAENQVWTEVWLRDDGTNVIHVFEELLAAEEIEFKAGFLKFPERLVKVINANNAELSRLTNLSDYIAEYRLAKVTATIWADLPNMQQAERVNNILERRTVNETNSVVCILDTGINNLHPLISDALDNNDCLTIDATWGTHDHDKHGTLMAGIALYGDLNEVLNNNNPVNLNHRLESVKLLPPNLAQNPANLWGYLTSQAISIAEINAPQRNRTICMAITANDNRDRGRPTSWSAQLDQVSSGAEDDTRRLILVSAGNITSTVADAANNYPEIQLTDSIQDPAQSWNSLTVGAYTKLTTITDNNLVGFQSVAPKNGLSPFTTTSLDWDENRWPIKPELILEGGNLAKDNMGFATEADELSLLSTFFDPQTSHFYPFNMTSAATAELARLSGKIQALHPDFWPETVRGLLVHSATWPEKIKEQFLLDQSKTSYKRLLSICGFGVPNIERALYSATNNLTLIAQETLQPFDKNLKGNYATNEMHLYELPWPTDVLEEMPFNTQVEMRITLSYFIEPGPGEIGWKDRYRYPSHGLRFELTSPDETKEEFKKRINAAARDAGEGKPDTVDVYKRQSRLTK